MGVVEESEQKQPSIKHYCRVCNRGFGCAGALGGHMRTHGVGVGGGETRFQPNVDKGGMSDIVTTRSKPEGSKHSYFLRTNTNRILSTHRFGGDEDNNLVVRPHDDRGKCRLDDGFSRPYPSSESIGDDGMIMKFKRAEVENCDEQQNCSASREEQDLANCLVMLSNKCFINKEDNKAGNKEETEKGSTMFQCKACKKFFSSHQALGGHRASHKKVKGCFAAKINNLNEDDSIEDDLININPDEILQGSYYSSEPGFDHLDLSSDHQVRKSSRVTKSKSRDHQCSICQRVFTSGQALGGHKRCHWLTSNNLPDTTLIQNLRDQFQFDSPQTEMFKKPMLETDRKIDLNFPPQNTNSLSNYETPGRVFLKLWGNDSNDQLQQHGGKVHESLHGCDDNSGEEECRIKKAKLNELKDVNLDGGSTSRWLQMGIASTTDIYVKKTATP